MFWTKPQKRLPLGVAAALALVASPTVRLAALNPSVCSSLNPDDDPDILSALKSGRHYGSELDKQKPSTSYKERLLPLYRKWRQGQEDSTEFKITASPDLAASTAGRAPVDASSVDEAMEDLVRKSKAGGFSMLTLQGCPYCKKAEELLSLNGISPADIALSRETTNLAQWQQWMEANARARTFPRIWHNQKLIGGYDDLYRIAQAKGWRGV